MTKSKFKEALKYQHNSVRIVGGEKWGMKIANVGWLNKPWLLIEHEETFEDAKADNFIPIDHFRTVDDLYETYKNLITKYE